MKTIYLVMIMVCSHYSYGQKAEKAQTDPVEIRLRYDYTKGTLIKPKNNNLKRGDYYKIIITNVNTAIHKGKFDVKDFNITSEPPALPASLIPITNVLTPLATFTETSDDSFPLEVFNKTIIQPRLSRNDSILSLLYEESRKAYTSLRRINSDANNLYERAIKNIEETSGEREGTDPTEKDLEDYREEAQSILESIGGGEIEEIETFIPRKIEYVSILLKKANSIAEKDSTLQSLLYTSKISGIYQDLVVNKAKFINSLDFVKRSAKAKSLIESPVINPDKDGFSVKVKIVDMIKKDSVIDQSFKFYTPRKAKFSFYTGGFVSNLVDDEFYLVAKDSTTSLVKKETVDNRDISLGGMGVVEVWVSPYLSVGPGIGASWSPFDNNIRYLAGLSASFGRFNRLGLQVGYAWGKMKHLSSGVKLDAETNELTVPSTITAVPTYKKIKSGWFVGVTYSIGKINLK